MKIFMLLSLVCLSTSRPQQSTEEIVNSFNNNGEGAGNSEESLVSIDTKDTKVNNAAQQNEEQNIDVSVTDQNAIDDSMDVSNQNAVQEETQVSSNMKDYTANGNYLDNLNENSNAAAQSGSNQAGQDLYSYNDYETQIGQPDNYYYDYDGYDDGNGDGYKK